MALTQKQEAFTLAFFECGNASEAYRRAYDVNENTKDHWLHVEASQLLDHPEVALRLQELRATAERHSIFTRQKAMEEYERAREVAEKVENPGAMVSAINGKVKLWGLEAPSKSRLEHVGKDGGPIETEEVSPRDRIASRIASLAARNGADKDPSGSDQ